MHIEIYNLSLSVELIFVSLSLPLAFLFDVVLCMSVCLLLPHFLLCSRTLSISLARSLFFHRLPLHSLYFPLCLSLPPPTARMVDRETETAIAKYAKMWKHPELFLPWQTGL